jgi:hypothetical protein
MEDSKRIEIIKDFVDYCQSNLEIEQLPTIELTEDKYWPITYRSFGQYIPSQNSLTLYIGNRNLADILRTLSHELVHHRQNELGMLKNDSGNTGSEIENQANSISGILMRNYGQVNELIYESKLKFIAESIIRSKFTIYCDMDGVLTDFEAQFDHYYGMNPREYAQMKGPELMKKAVDDVGLDFWAKMPLFPGALELWSFISKYQPIILSSPSTFKHAKKGKDIWITNNLKPAPSDIIYKQTGHKEEAIQGLPESEIKRSILIDDYYRNLAPWKELGAIGITHKSAQQTINILKKFRL